MLLDREVCDRARLARDARLDGRFFTGVVTTGVYCRPICPVRPAGSQNVRFFPSAAAAEWAGFRPCLRCRPEAAPGTPAWQGSASVVSRGLGLINRGFLDEHSSADLAAVLGVGTRQLTRLFTKYLGATPGAVARTRRVQMAKRLLDETTVSVTEIAFAAGFSSIRRFNAVFAETYGWPPSQIRRSSPVEASRAATIRIRLAYRRPFHWPTFAALLAGEAIPGVEAADECAYRRTISVDGRDGWFEVSPTPGADCLALTLCLPGYAKLRSVVERVRALFDLNADPARIGAQLAHHPHAAPLLAEASDLRLPGAWDGFELAIRTLVVNDVGHADATPIMRRLVADYGVHLASPPQVGPDLIFPTAGCLAEASLSDYGLSCQTVNSVRRLARAVRNGKICFSPTQTFEDLVGHLQ
jgi:AraC family transcriptional regulator, regulatory protein of adaptative response / DNA-3-methyladenine glycosylase II